MSNINNYCNYGSYLRNRGTDTQICNLQTQIDNNNLTNGGTVDGNLTVTGNITSDGSLNISTDEIILTKQTGNIQQTNLFGEVITILDISNISVTSTGTDLSFVCDLSGILYSNSDSSNAIYQSVGNELLMDISGNKNHFVNSYIEMFIHLTAGGTGAKTIEYSYFNFKGINNTFTVDTRSFSKSNDPISVTYGPSNFLTGTDGILTDQYKLVFYVKSNAVVTFSNIRFTIKQKVF